MGKEIFNKVDVILLIRTSCTMCNRVENSISKQLKLNNYINFQIIDIDKESIQFGNRHNSITPSLWVDGNMWYAGSFEIESFESKLKDLLHKKGEYHE